MCVLWQTCSNAHSLLPIFCLPVAIPLEDLAHHLGRQRRTVQARLFEGCREVRTAAFAKRKWVGLCRAHILLAKSNAKFLGMLDLELLDELLYTSTRMFKKAPPASWGPAPQNPVIRHDMACPCMGPSSDPDFFPSDLRCTTHPPS